MPTRPREHHARVWLLALLVGNALVAGLILLEQAFPVLLAPRIVRASGGVVLTMERFSQPAPLIAVMLSSACAWMSIRWSRDREPVLVLSVIAGVIGIVALSLVVGMAGEHGWALTGAELLHGWQQSSLLVRLRFDALYDAACVLASWHLLAIVAAWRYGRRLPASLRSHARCRCGYSLEGLPGPKCPECGRDASTRVMTAVLGRSPIQNPKSKI